MKRNRIPFGSTIALVLTLSIMAAAQTNNVRPVIEANEAKFSKFFAKGDAKSVSDLYSETAKILPPNGEIAEGRTKIRNFWQGAWDSGVKKAETKAVEIIGSGNSVSEVGTYILFGAQNEILDEGKYIVVWKKEGRNWMLFRDIWNSNRK